MPAADILDRREPVGKHFSGSLVLHGAILGAMLASPLFKPKASLLGSPEHNSGTIGVSVIKTIPIPQREGPVNRVANDTQSTVPQKPEPKVAPKPVEKPKAPPKDAILLPNKEKQKPKRIEQATSNPYRPEKAYERNQVFSQTPQAMKAPEYGIQGSGGIGVGPANPFGQQFGWYAQQIFDRVSQKWNRADVTSRPHARAVVRFTLLRNGSVQNVEIAQPSGSYTLDTSSQRAVLDAAPFPPFPAGFNYNSISVDLNFELQQ
jgi:protein TonB